MITTLFAFARRTLAAPARWVPLAALLAVGVGAQAQVVTQPVGAYTFSASTGTYTPLTSASGFAQDILQDDNVSRPLPIGFEFPFEGGRPTTVLASSDGWLSFSNTINLANSLAPGSSIIAPFWDNLNGFRGSASYVTLGTAPNRVFTMQWSRWLWPAQSTSLATEISFQVKLYETSGVIQFIYQREPGVPSGDLSASIGLAGGNSRLSLSDASAAPTTSTSVSTNTIAQRPATGQIYTFTPPAPCPAATGVTAVATSSTTATVNFVPGGGNPTNYTVYYRETASSTGSQTVTATTSPALLTGLQPNTEYAVQVVSNCSNGSPSWPVDVYFTTLAPPNGTATWTGAVSTAWAVGGNWSTGTVPTLTTDVTIGPGTNQPTLTGMAVCGALTLQAGATLTLAAGAPTTRLTTDGTVQLASGSTLVQAAGTTLAVGQALTNRGATLTLAPSSTVAFAGGNGQHALNGPAATVLQNLVLGELSANDELTLTAALQVQRLLKCTQGAFVEVGTGGALTLGPAAQLVRDNTGFVNGDVTVVRDLAAGGGSGLGYRYFSPSVRLATVGQLATTGFAPVVNPAYNTSPNPASVTPFPTVFAYDQSGISTNADALADFERGFYSPDALSETLVQGLGYRLDAPGTTTIRLTGLLNNSNVTRGGLTRATLPQSGYHLLGNPYPSVLDWNVLAAATTTTGLDAAVYVYQSTGPTTGQYQAYVNGIGGPRYLLPGQGFFVRVSSARTPGSLTFTNAARLSSYFDPATPPAAPAETRPLLQLTLAGSSGPTDAATVYFEAGATAGFDSRYDASKLPTRGVPALAFAGSVPLAISGLPALGTADVTLPLDVQVPSAGAYTLSATQRLNLPAGTYAYLLDSQTGAAQDLSQQATYAFTLAAGATAPRFSLLLTRTALSAAPAALSQRVAVYPSPARGTAYVQLPTDLHRQPLQAALLNQLGQVVRTLNLPAATGARPLPLAGVAPGLYSVRLTTPQGSITKRLLVE